MNFWIFEVFNFYTCVCYVPSLYFILPTEMILFTCALMLPSSNSCWSRISSGSFLLSDVKLSGFWFADVVLKGLVKVFDFLE